VYNDTHTKESLPVSSCHYREKKSSKFSGLEIQLFLWKQGGGGGGKSGGTKKKKKNLLLVYGVVGGG
jgi:hypothetical protein